METVGERIKRMRLEKGWTQKDLALYLGLKNDTAIANYESNYSIPKDEIKYKLCELFDCTMDYLMGNSIYKNYNEFEEIDKLVLNYNRTEDETKIISATLNYINTHPNTPIGEILDKYLQNLPISEKELLRNIIVHLNFRYHGELPKKEKNISNNKKFHMCPVYGKISAGIPNWAEECLEGYLPIDPNLFGIINPDECFFLKVNGESMNKEIRNGAYALIRKQDIVEDGEIAAILVNGFEATLKRFSRQGDFIILEPMSTDDSFKTQIYDTNTQIKILGKYIGKFEMNK